MNSRAAAVQGSFARHCRSWPVRQARSLFDSRACCGCTASTYQASMLVSVWSALWPSGPQQSKLASTAPQASLLLYACVAICASAELTVLWSGSCVLLIFVALTARSDCCLSLGRCSLAVKVQHGARCVQSWRFRKCSLIKDHTAARLEHVLNCSTDSLAAL